MKPDLDLIKESYSKFEDFKIEHIAIHEVSSLHPDVIPILIEEIKKRGLDNSLIKGIEEQTKELTESDLIKLKNKIMSLRCPECGQINPPLVGTIIRTVISFIIMTSSRERVIIACKSCSTTKRKNDIFMTAILGWWGFPFGLFRTPISLIRSYKDSQKLDDISNDIITQFCIDNVGVITTLWHDDEKLIDYIKQGNK